MAEVTSGKSEEFKPDSEGPHTDHYGVASVSSSTYSSTEQHNQQQAKPTTVSYGDLASEVDGDPDFALELDMKMKAVHRTVSNVIFDLEGNSSVGTIMEEYKKLYKALKESYSSQKKLMMECTSLKCDIKNNAEKVNMAIHLAQEDKEIIKNLTKQVKHAWNEVDTYSEKETKAKVIINKLKDEVSTLTTLLESASGVQEILLVAKQAQAERKDLEDAFLVLKDEIELKDLKIQEVNERLGAKEEAFQRELKKKKDKLEAIGKDKEQVQEKYQELESSYQFLERSRAGHAADNLYHIGELDACRAKLAKTEKEEQDVRTELAKCTQMYNEQQEVMLDKSREIAKLITDGDSLKRRVQMLQNSNTAQKEKLEEKEIDAGIAAKNLKRADAEIETLAKRYEQSTTQVRIIQNYLSERERELKVEQEHVKILKANLASTQTYLQKIQTDAENAQRMCDLESNKNQKLVSKKTFLERSVVLKERSIMGLMKEINVMSKQIAKALETVSMLELDKERLYERIGQVLEMVNNLATDNDNKEAKLLMLLTLNNEHEMAMHTTNTKLTRMTNLRDKIRNELHLIELKNDELLLANRNFSKQSTSLAEDLHNREKVLGNLRASNNHLKNEIAKLHGEINTRKDESEKDRKKLNEREETIKTLNKMLCKQARRIGDISITLDGVIQQRNVLGYQCSQKIEHIQFLKEKNQVLRDFFALGNRAYNQQSQKVADMQTKIDDLYRQKRYIMAKIENADNLKSKLGLANQQLVVALAKCRAMEGEHPYNMHRWRHLKAVDISQYEMVIKIQHLLKQVIFKTDEVTKLERIIVDKTTVVTEMKRALERRPGLEVVERAKADEDARRDMTNKLKAALAEKNLVSCKSDRQVYVNRCLMTRLMDEKKKNLELNRQNQRLHTRVGKLPAIVKKFSG